MEKDSKELKEELKAQKNKNKELKEKLDIQKTQFEAQLSDINKKIEMIMNSPPSEIFTPTPAENYDDVSIRPDKYVGVRSLTRGTLILKGNNRIYKFSEYGEVVRIVYADIMDIVHNHIKMAREGAFYIMDDNVVSVQGLEEFYKNVLDKKALDDLILQPSKEFEKIFALLSKLQKNVVVNNIVKAIIEGQDISSTITTIVNKQCGVSIDAMVDEFQNFEKDVLDIENEKK